MLEEWSKTFIWLGPSTTQTFHSALPEIPSAEISLASLLFLPQSSVQFSRSVMSDSLQPHRLQHARLPYPSPTPGAYSNSCPSHRWCHPTISSSVITFSSSSFNLSYYQGLFHWVSSSHQVAKVLEFQLQHQASNEYSGLISLVDWLSLLGVQGTLKSFL